MYDSYAQNKLFLVHGNRARIYVFVYDSKKNYSISEKSFFHTLHKKSNK